MAAIGILAIIIANRGDSPTTSTVAIDPAHGAFSRRQDHGRQRTQSDGRIATEYQVKTRRRSG